MWTVVCLVRLYIHVGPPHKSTGDGAPVTSAPCGFCCQIHDLVKSALGSSGTMPADTASDPASLASLMDQIENLSISRQGKSVSLNAVSAELMQMRLTSAGDQASSQGSGSQASSGVDVPSGEANQTRAEQMSAKLGQVSLSPGGGDATSACGASAPPAPGCS